jgi:hypothetical protein
MSNEPSSSAASQLVKITRTNEERKVVYGMVYEPNVLDTWGEMMLAADIETMAHRFMRDVVLADSIDKGHNEKPTGCYPIESFIARAGDPDYPEGSWVLGVKITDDNTWAEIKRGDLNGFSFQCMVRKLPAIVEVEVPIFDVGQTEAVDDHQHLFYVEYDNDGVAVRGRTSTVNGHSHEIFGSSATEVADGHSHRYFLP